MSARQESQEFFTGAKYMCFGIILISKKDGKVVKHKFNIISEILSQTAYKVVCCLKKIMSTSTFKNLAIKKLIIFSDGAKHFQNQYVVGFWNELCMQTASRKNPNLNFGVIVEELSSFNPAVLNIYHNIEDVEHNFFVEYHGKLNEKKNIKI